MDSSLPTLKGGKRLVRTRIFSLAWSYILTCCRNLNLYCKWSLQVECFKELNIAGVTLVIIPKNLVSVFFFVKCYDILPFSVIRQIYLTCTYCHLKNHLIPSVSIHLNKLFLINLYIIKSSIKMRIFTKAFKSTCR